MDTIIPPSRERPPFLPEDRDLARSLIRAMTAHVLCHMSKPQEPASEIAERAWPRDRAAHVITRGAVPPLSLGGTSALQATVTGAFVSGLQLESAAAQLIRAGITVDLTGIYAVSIPRAAPGSQPVPAFYAEGAPIAVGQGVVSSTPCGPARALKLIEALTEELAGFGASNAEVVIRTIMVESAARALDGAVLSAAAADSTRPAGILAGVTPIAAATGGGLTAAMTDIGAMVAAIAAAGGGRRIMLFLPPAKAVTLPMMAQTIVPNLELVPAPSLTTSVVAVDPAGYVSAFGSEPRFDIGRAATLHMEGATPLPIASPGSPNTIAAPVQSMYQTDSFALRLSLPCSWAMRAPGLVQTVSGISW